MLKNSLLNGDLLREVLLDYYVNKDLSLEKMAEELRGKEIDGCYFTENLNRHDLKRLLISYEIPLKRKGRPNKKIFKNNKVNYDMEFIRLTPIEKQEFIDMGLVKNLSSEAKLLFEIYNELSQEDYDDYILSKFEIE